MSKVDGWYQLSGDQVIAHKVGEFVDLTNRFPVQIAILEGIDAGGRPQYGFRIDFEDLDGDEVLAGGEVWGLEDAEDAKTASVAFLSGWCARMRAERRAAAHVGR